MREGEEERERAIERERERERGNREGNNRKGRQNISVATVEKRRNYEEKQEKENCYCKTLFILHFQIFLAFFKTILRWKSGWFYLQSIPDEFIFRL